jgi:hypothetical protein
MDAQGQTALTEEVPAPSTLDPTASAEAGAPLAESEVPKVEGGQYVLPQSVSVSAVPSAETDEPDFIQSAAFCGAKTGYAFKTGEIGLGYDNEEYMQAQREQEGHSSSKKFIPPLGRTKGGHGQPINIEDEAVADELSAIIPSEDANPPNTTNCVPSPFQSIRDLNKGSPSANMSSLSPLNSECLSPPLPPGPPVHYGSANIAPNALTRPEPELKLLAPTPVKERIPDLVVHAASVASSLIPPQQLYQSHQQQRRRRVRKRAKGEAPIDKYTALFMAASTIQQQQQQQQPRKSCNGKGTGYGKVDTERAGEAAGGAAEVAGLAMVVATAGEVGIASTLGAVAAEAGAEGTGGGVAGGELVAGAETGVENVARPRALTTALTFPILPPSRLPTYAQTLAQGSAYSAPKILQRPPSRVYPSVLYPSLHLHHPQRIRTMGDRAAQQRREKVQAGRLAHDRDDRVLRYHGTRNKVRKQGVSVRCRRNAEQDVQARCRQRFLAQAAKGSGGACLPALPVR